MLDAQERSSRKWWHLSADETSAALETDVREGLGAARARERLATFGPNRLQEQKGRGPLAIFFEQFQNLIIWVLIGAAVVSGFLGEWIDSAAILAIVVLNAILGLLQEHKAEKSLAALKKMAAPNAKVVRDGTPAVIPAAELVPGDLVELEAGDNAPADARLIWVTPNFATQEASLTGESQPVAKAVRALAGQDVALADRANMVYMGTSVAAGKGRALVAETGMTTELGKIAGLIQTTQKISTPLQKRLEQFGQWIIYLAFVLVAVIFGLELLRGGRLIDVFLTAVSLAVAAIPEGLPAVVTIALALGVQRMVKRHVLIRKLHSVETLGSATVICSDKTGTLTRNEMTVRVVRTAGSHYQVTGIGYEPEGEFQVEGRAVDARSDGDLVACLRGAVLCNGARLQAGGNGVRTSGDPTEIALLTAAAKLDIWKDREERDYPFLEEIPFDSERKKMTILRTSPAGVTAFTKGAPDVLLSDCDSVLEGGRVRPLTADDRSAILRAVDRLSGEALRVLAMASRDFPDMPADLSAAAVERGLIFLGLAAMIDPPRPEVKTAVQKCRKSGIRTVMITGDHKNTATAIARELDFFGPASRALTGEELDRLSDDEFAAQVDQIAVYARVSPEHKLRAVRAWRKRGDVVAMTGDGVNDAPAVKEADIGVAMGITGTDVTKEVSEMVVTDDNFASIVAAVEEGRGIYDNIKKFIHFLLSCNSGEILVMFVASLLGYPVPLLPIQILWVNLVTDGFPALALGMDPVDPHIMDRPPRRPDEAVITRPRLVLILVQGAFIAVCSLAAFLFVLRIENEGLGRARTAALAVLACAQIFHAFNSRSQRRSLFRIGFGTNRMLVGAAVLSFALQLAIIYLPFFQPIFKTEPLGLHDLGLIVVFSSLPLWAMEALKALNRRFKIYDLD